MVRKRELIAENRRIILGGLIPRIRANMSGYGPHAAEAACALIEEFTRRAQLPPEGPPPGHPPLPGLEAPVEDIKVGDTIRCIGVPAGVADVVVLAVGQCSNDYVGDPLHSAYLIKDPETDEPDWVCSKGFMLVSSA